MPKVTFVTSPVLAGVVIDRINVSDNVIPVKLLDASVLYPQVFTASAAGDPLADVGKLVPPFIMLVLDTALTYNL